MERLGVGKYGNAAMVAEAITSVSGRAEDVLYLYTENSQPR